MMDLSMLDLGGIYSDMTSGFRNLGIRKDKIEKEEFLMLLVTQLRYQNPLEPLENKDLVAQLSQLASLESISNMANSVKNFVDFNSSLVKAQAASMVGKHVVVRSNTVKIKDGVPEPVKFILNDPAHLVIKIFDGDDRVVYTEDLGNVDAGVHIWKWDGRDENGTPLEDGEYKFSLVKVNGDGTEEEVGGLNHGKVDAVQFDGDDIYLLVNGERYPVTALVEISEEVEEL